LKLKPRSLVQRIAWATWSLVAGSAACVALVSMLLADRFAEQHEEQHLTDAATLLIAKLKAHPSPTMAEDTLETIPSNVRVAGYRDQKIVAGDARIPRPAGEGCRFEGAVAICAVENGSYFAVATSDRAALLKRQRQTMMVPSLLAVLLTSLVGALLARRVATKLVAPLSRLHDAIERVPPGAPEQADVGADEDVAEVDALRRTLRDTFAQLGHSLATSRRFASDAAHELRSPLSVIMGQLELGSLELTGEARLATERARTTAARLATLVERLLVLATPAAKLGAGEEVELHGAVEDALDLLPVGAWPRIAVTAEAKAFVLGDRTLLAAMIANGLENALKFSEGNVQVLLRATTEQAELRIQDDGPGIPELHRERVFEPFFRTPEARSGAVRGHGIGLSLIAHVARVHGGSPHFAATERGTCLVIVLPRSR
jgi:signal transduction histidine kinase